MCVKTLFHFNVILPVFEFQIGELNEVQFVDQVSQVPDILKRELEKDGFNAKKLSDIIRDSSLLTKTCLSQQSAKPCFVAAVTTFLVELIKQLTAYATEKVKSSVSRKSIDYLKSSIDSMVQNSLPETQAELITLQTALHSTIDLRKLKRESKN